jgi:carboxyl-terminal processing protease
MKKNYKRLIAVICLSATLFAFTANPKKAVDPDKDKLLLELLMLVIKKEHYKSITIDDNFSKAVYKEYIEALDPSRRFFLQSDINEFSRFQLELDDQLTNKDLTFFNLTYDRLMLRMEESKKVFKDVLGPPFDYKIEEDFNIDYEKTPYAKNNKELKNKWRKQIKLSTLSSLIEKQKFEEDKKIKDPAYVEKLYAVLEKETRENSLKSLNESMGFMSEFKREDWFTLYINSIMSQLDPHTSYLAPEEKEKFDVNISGKFEGIGAQLQKKNDYIEVLELISGGPAWRGKQLEKGDLIFKVAQSNGVPVDVAGMRLVDAIKKIKGPKGSEVRLTVKKADGAIYIIPIIRDVVEIEETYAKSSIVVKNGSKYGVIYLPKFYIDFENKDGRDAGTDVAMEVDRLKKAGVKGIILDVRDDGGGSLSAVVDIAGLFIEQGPIVQVKSAMKKEILYDTDKKIGWDGPLVIMVNEFSASASEILAAAIQDYKRGIIVGSKQTYGKGTVQRVIDLNQYIKNSSLGDFGALKTTIQKFYRITGGSTQLEGVSSDVVMPDRYAYLNMGERDEIHALPWDKIEPASYTVWNNTSKFDMAIMNSRKRIEKNIQFQLIEENANWINSRNSESIYSLNIDKFKEAQNQVEQTDKKFKPIADYKNNLKFTSLPYELERFAKDPILKEKRESWHESLSKDIYVEEALNILNDLQSKSIAKTNGNAPKKVKQDIAKK